MDKDKILEKYKKEEDRLLISKLLDKIQLCEKQNKIQCTDFLSPIEVNLAKKILNLLGVKNYILWGGNIESQRNSVVIYPSKLENIFNDNKFNFNTIFNCIRVTNVNEKLEHKLYLGGLIKLGVKREKIGDIIVFDNGADIIVNNDITKFLLSNMQQLTRFKNSNIEVVDVLEITNKQQEFKELKIIVSSLRLDNIISELANTSRNKSLEILKQERVLVNYEREIKNTKLIKKDDLITIRGIGKFIISDIVGNTRSGRFIINVKKYI